MKNDPMPPLLFQRFFSWFCRPQLHDSIEGDLFELYRERVRTKGKGRADLHFIIDVLLLLRPEIIRSVNQPRLSHQNKYSMLKSYFRIAWRNIVKDKATGLPDCEIFLASLNGIPVNCSVIPRRL